MRARKHALSPALARPASPTLPHSRTRALPSTRYLFFGGKGGVGKTTAAAAAALHLLDRAHANERILLFSTDPAHSLSDSLGVEIGDRITEVANHGKARLEAREMDASAALEQFKSKHRDTLKQIADRGTLLDETDIDELLDLSLPGLDEVMALFELSDLDSEQSYTTIVVDTAPSGHTTRLLGLPALFADWLGALDRLSQKHRYIIAQLARGRARREDEAELFLKELSQSIERVGSMLYDPDRAAFILVTTPEAMSVEETSRYFETLKQQGVPVADLIINRVEQEHDDCRYCRGRARGQKPWLKKIVNEFDSLNLREARLFSQEIRGFDALRGFALEVWGEAQKPGGARKAKKKQAKRSSSSSDSGHRPFDLSPFHASEIESQRLLIFGGKGGVGKTTAAAATALALAERNPQAQVLIFSTDPAHSLSDSFDERVGELKRKVAGLPNLDAMEIDPARWLEGLKQRYQGWTDELFESITAGSRWEIQFDREAMREIVQLAPPGIDEIAALSRISDLLDEARYDSIILDTAPTGHLIRFLELPAVALSWVRALIKLLLKYKGMVRWEGLAEELIALSKSIKRVAALLTDAQECEFIRAAIPERMSLEETIRLTETLKRLKVPMRRILINNVVPERAAETCDFCAARLGSQTAMIKEFGRAFRDGSKLILAFEQPRGIRGRKALGEHFAHWQNL